MTEQANATQVRQRQPLVVTIFNQKGGIGKTTTSVNLAVVLAAMGRRVAIIDLDSQNNATSSLGMAVTAAPGAYRLLSGAGDLAETMLATPFPGLSLCAASDELVGADIELAMTETPQVHLRDAIRARPAEVDVVLIDCPPALGMLPVNALVASDLALLPVSPEPLAREGLLKAWRHTHRIRANLNPTLEVLGILLTMVDKTPVHREFASTLKAEFGRRVLPVTVPRDPAVLEASAQEMPVAVFDPESAAARAYVDLAALLLVAGERRAAALPEEAMPDLSDWLQAPVGETAHAATRAVLLGWREQAQREAPQPLRPLPPAVAVEHEEALPSARAGHLWLPLSAGLFLGFALGANLSTLRALAGQLVR